jgi:hypothetical protein
MIDKWTAELAENSDKEIKTWIASRAAKGIKVNNKQLME